MVFSTDWFNQHQKLLLRILNFKPTKILVRKVLDIDTQEKLCKFSHNHYTIYLGKDGDKLNIRSQFVADHYYSKKLYHYFYYLLWIMHAWDLLVDNKAPELSFGFNTLPTVNPQTGNGGANVDFDGRYEYSKKPIGNWNSDVRSSTSNATVTAATGASGVMVAAQFEDSGGGDDDGNCNRSTFGFNTSALTGNATVTTAVLGIRGQAKNTIQGSVGSGAVNIYTHALTAPVNAINAGDYKYTQWGTTVLSTAITYSSWSTTGYNNFTLNATGIAAVSLTGITTLGARESYYDAANNTLINGNQFNMSCYFADNGSLKPTLDISYTVPATATGNFFLVL